MDLDPIIGTSLPRKDGRMKVIGRAKYGADINFTVSFMRRFATVPVRTV
jgi:CO/xanthine dehydrogenase Mo-binding subunit